MSDEVGGQDKEAGRQGWWLATQRRRPEWQALSVAGLASFAGRPKANFEAAQRGDPVLIYVATPDKAIRAAGIVVREVVAARNKEVEGEEAEGDKNVEVQLAFEIPNPLAWRDIAETAALASAEPVKQRSSGNLFYLSPPDYRTLREMIIERNPELAAAFVALDAGDISSLRAYPAAKVEQRQVREAAPEYVAQPQPVEEPAEFEPQVAAVENIAELGERTMLPEPMLREISDLLLEANQIVLTGPPGTGKTWLARGLAALAAGDPARVRVTQFHPSTSYEDFVEGLKPRVNAWGQVTYAVLPGLFSRLCATARADPDNRYVLIIDEINRAPLARVFGELLYALEYRGPLGAVALAASAGGGAGGSFYVPENVLLIGTMNSADRSIALVDYALRRRFRFVELEPSAEVLRAWLERQGISRARRDTLVDLMEETNRRLLDTLGPDFQIGHSYFMLPEVDGRSLDRLWRTALRPLLIEYFLPNTIEVQEFAAMFAAAGAALDAG